MLNFKLFRNRGSKSPASFLANYEQQLDVDQSANYSCNFFFEPSQKDVAIEKGKATVNAAGSKPTKEVSLEVNLKTVVENKIEKTLGKRRMSIRFFNFDPIVSCFNS